MDESFFGTSVMGEAHGLEEGTIMSSRNISETASSTIRRLQSGVRYAFWDIGAQLVFIVNAAK